MLDYSSGKFYYEFVLQKLFAQIKSPYGIGKSLQWLWDYAREGNKNNPLSLVDIPQDVVLSDEIVDKRIVFLGDLMGTNKKRLFFSKELKEWFQNTNHVVANLEGPLWETDDVVFVNQHNPPQLLENLSDLAPIEKWVFSLANNHIFDYGPAGLAQTKAIIEKSGAQWLGLKERPTIELGPIDISATTEFTNKPTDEVVLCHQLKTDGRKDKYKILFVHWGQEFAYFPQVEQKQQRDAKWKDFDFVIGHHSHTPQPLVYENKKGTAYSLGNFYIYFNKKMLREGKVLRLSFSKNKLVQIEWKKTNVSRITNQEIHIS